MNRGPIPHRPALTDDDGEVRELTVEDFRRGVSTLDEFPDFAAAVEKLRGQRGAQRTPTKERIGLRLDRAVVDHFRATGPGWQARINALLLEHVNRSDVAAAPASPHAAGRKS